MSYDFEIGKVYTFNTVAPGILQATFKNAKAIAKLDYDTAKMFDNIDLKFRQIYPVLPTGTPNTPESCIYWRFVSESGEKVILADVWINDGTVDTIEGINFQVNFTNGSLEDMNRVRDACLALGFTNFEIKQV